jgi:hypothetical protein
MIAACVAEMASAIPSAASVYHWASVTGGQKYGRVIGYFAGWYVAVIAAQLQVTHSMQVESFRLDIRCSVYVVFSRQSDRQHVRPLPSRLYIRALARLRRLYDHHVGVLSCCHVRQPRTPNSEQNRSGPDSVRLLHHYPGLCHYAVADG